MARTEEAAKKGILRQDPSAKRGAAQQLLDLDREVSRLASAKQKAQKAASESGHTCKELQSQCHWLKGRLRTVMSDQRRLVVQLGQAEQKTGKRLLGAAQDGAQGRCTLGNGENIFHALWVAVPFRWQSKSRQRELASLCCCPYHLLMKALTAVGYKSGPKGPEKVPC